MGVNVYDPAAGGAGAWAASAGSQDFSLSASGIVVTGVSGKSIKVYGVVLVVSAATAINFRDGSSTDLEGAQNYAANGGRTETVNPPAFLFATTPGQSLELVNSGGGVAAGRVSYWTE